MEVKPGYKQTEVGVIPEEWEVCRLSSLVVSGPKNGYSGRSGKDARGTPTLALTATTSGRMILDEETLKHLEETLEQNSDVFLKAGDVLVQRSNTPDLVGTTAIFDGPSGVFAYPDLMMRLRFKAQETARWFWRYANSSSGRRYFVSVAAGSTGTMPKISGDKLRNMPLPLPKPPEQRAIATALSDVDALLGALDRLIAKKRDLKQAAMQQLLTGQTRLPGFHGAWEVTTLGEVATFLSGGTPSRSNDEYWNGEIPWISAMSLRCFDVWRSDSNVTEEAVASGSKIAPIDSTLLLVRGSALHKEILCGLVTKRVCFNQDVKAMIPYSNVFPRFLTWLIRGRADDFLKLVSSAGNTAGVLDTKLLKAFQFLLPERLEQIAIAAVLTEMDAELAVLEHRQAKTRALKQGMMQELLTGKTRLPVQL